MDNIIFKQLLQSKYCITIFVSPPLTIRSTSTPGRSLSLKQKGPLKGVTGIEGRKRDVNRAGDPKSEGDRQIFKKTRKN